MVVESRVIEMKRYRPFARKRTECPYSACSIDSKPAVRNISLGGEAMIKKVKGGYRVLSSKGRNMGGPYKTREEAAKRLRQVEFFKRQKG
jgi:hypothetical protein